MFEEFRNEFKIDIFICFNGLIVVDNQIIYKNPLNKEV